MHIGGDEDQREQHRQDPAEWEAPAAEAGPYRALPEQKNQEDLPGAERQRLLPEGPEQQGETKHGDELGVLQGANAELPQQMCVSRGHFQLGYEDAQRAVRSGAEPHPRRRQCRHHRPGTRTAARTGRNDDARQLGGHARPHGVQSEHPESGQDIQFRQEAPGAADRRRQAERADRVVKLRRVISESFKSIRIDWDDARV